MEHADHDDDERSQSHLDINDDHEMEDSRFVEDVAVSFQSLPVSASGSPYHSMAFKQSLGSETRESMRYSLSSPPLTAPLPPPRSLPLSLSLSPASPSILNGRHPTYSNPHTLSTNAYNALNGSYDHSLNGTPNGTAAAHTPSQTASAAPLDPIFADAEPGAQSLAQEARLSHSALLSSLCAYFTESTERHLSQSLASLTQFYEDVLQREREQRERERSALQDELHALQAEHTALQTAHKVLHAVHETRTERLTAHYLAKHLVRSDVAQPFSLVSLFTAWKRHAKRHTRAKKLERFVARERDRETLRVHFAELHRHKVAEKHERKLAEIKFKHETLCNEMSRAYEQEITHVKHLHSEALSQIEVERDKRRSVENDVRALFMQSVSQMNQQALSLFQRVEEEDVPVPAGVPASTTAAAAQAPTACETTPASQSAKNGLFGEKSVSSRLFVSQQTTATVSERARDSLSLSPQPRSVLPTGNGFSQLTPTILTPTPPLTLTQPALTTTTQPSTPSSSTQITGRRFSQSSSQSGPSEQPHYERLSDLYSRAVTQTHAANGANGGAPLATQQQRAVSSTAAAVAVPHYMQNTQNGGKNTSQTTTSRASAGRAARAVSPHNTPQSGTTTAQRTTMMSQRRSTSVKR